MNRNLRSGIRIAIIVLGLNFLSLFTATPSNAVFGLSKCEKFKKEITSYEKAFNSQLYALAQYKNQLLKGQAKIIYDNLRNSDSLYQIWKSAYNNSTCLTNTQKDQIPALKQYYIGTFVDIDTGVFTKNTAFCKKDLNFLLDSCRFTDDDRLRNVFILKSIFDY